MDTRHSKELLKYRIFQEFREIQTCFVLQDVSALDCLFETKHFQQMDIFPLKNTEKEPAQMKMKTQRRNIFFKMVIVVHSLVNLIETDSQNGNDVISF